ncbi:ubiquinol-cytochrome c reductase cytochrome c subunit [Micromonospora pattaloongensis]|uniref:Ubiquinol-cytochrome c reductase cytochrome c subunit n=1 Tax=Micromonospora pattaloongensis TaxID=405436 RepID=A0A1H3R5V6_9ACTN|nr:c-type cytochrome [Micromonospora pattaloongensis]SDZ20903.1 ubiquinol-cytochrome c reductase cytochrome c subunit [Micromonospora pattaloongensis]
MRRPRALTLPTPHPRRALAVGSVLALAVGPVALAPAPAPTPAPTPSASTPTANRGTQLYLEQCASCHGPQGQGSQQGPSLIDVGPASVDFQLSTGRMPLSHETQQAGRRPPVFSAEEISALVGHVASFGGGPQIPQVRPGDVVSGRDLFAANCAPCHGAAGSGAVLTNGWTAPPLYDSTAVQVAEAVRVGPGLMPAFPSQVLTDRQVDDLTSYVRQLRSERLDRGGGSLARLGPLAEGLVGWVVVLGLLVGAVRWLGRRAGE